jgi:osmotically-inducible protein OsmY
MDDKQLQQSVIDELEFEPSVDAAHIGVTASDGVVTLTGHVPSYAEKVSAEYAARRVKGVRAIVSEIEVRYPEQAKTADDEIAKRALNVLKWNVVIPDEAVKVMVHKGLVTLTGDVTWRYQSKSAEEAIRKLTGVTGVINSIRIKPAVNPSDVKKKIEQALKRHAEIEAQAIRVTVADGKISLHGTVDSWDEREAAEDAAWSVPGVGSVDDRLVIGTGRSSAPAQWESDL